MEIPDESTLRKLYIEPLYSEKIEQIRKIVGQNPVYFIVDETMDACKRSVLNILVGTFNGEYSKPMLLREIVLESTNSTTVSQSIMDSFYKLWPNGIKYENVWLILSDQAKYMIKAVNSIRNLFPNIHHISCIVHALHLVCEDIRNSFENADKFVANFKKILSKSPKRIQKYKKSTELPLPPQPVVTRWGTWLNTCFFHIDNFKKIKTFLQKLSDESKAIKNAKELVNTEELENEFIQINEFRFLPKIIEKLETQGLRAAAQMEMLKEVQTKLGDRYLEKLESSISKNPDLKRFFENKDLEFKVKTTYAPLTSVDVERSFSRLKNILTDDRHKLTPDNMEKLIVIQYNAFLE